MALDPLRQLSGDLLRYWLILAKFRDQYGLPIDMMFYVLGQRGQLPQVFESGAWRNVTEDEFTQGMNDCVAVLQRRSPKGLDLTQEQIEIIRKLK